MNRTRAYYRALGYDSDYVWAHHETTPFEPLVRPLGESTVAVVTTASLSAPEGWHDGAVRQRRPVEWFAPSDTPPDFFTANLAWDKESTHTRDRASYLPLETLRQAVADGRIAALARRWWSVPTEYSQRLTREVDAPEIVAGCLEDRVDAALLVPL